MVTTYNLYYQVVLLRVSCAKDDRFNYALASGNINLWMSVPHATLDFGQYLGT